MAALAAAAVLVTGGIAAPAGAGAAPAAGHAGAPLTLSPSSTYPLRDRVLNGVSAVSGSDAWAVGYDTGTSALASTTLILHWNGTAWSKVKSPNPGLYSNELSGVSAVSGSNAWAVGSYYDANTGAAYKTLILHWNGTAWSKVKSPSPSSAFNELQGVSAVSGSNAWAVGRYDGYPARAYATLILHWNGTAWTHVKSPNPSPDPFSSNANWLFGVSARSGSDAWAVGDYDNNAIANSLVLHWNGTAWSQVKSPNLPNNNFTLNGVSARSGSDAWVAGDYGVNGSAFWDTLVLHWNGTAWSQISSPNPVPLMGENTLNGVSAVSGSGAWAVGDYQNSSVDLTHRTLILHWNGTAWKQISSPNPSSTDNFLNGVSAVSGSDAWAVGYYNNDTGEYRKLILHWNGTAWAKA